MTSQIKIPQIIYSIDYTGLKSEYIKMLLITGVEYLENNLSEIQESYITTFTEWVHWLSDEKPDVSIQIDISEPLGIRIDSVCKLMRIKGSLLVDNNGTVYRKTKKQDLTELIVWGYEILRKEKGLVRPNELTSFRDWLKGNNSTIKDKVLIEIDSHHISGTEFICSVQSFNDTFGYQTKAYQKAYNQSVEEIREEGGSKRVGDYLLTLVDNEINMKII